MSRSQLRALADPRRLRILECLGKKPRTTKQVATLLREKPTALYHHVGILEKAGLVKVVRTARKRGTIERYYALVQDRIRSNAATDPELLAAALQSALTEVLQPGTRRRLRGGPAGAVRLKLRASPAKIRKLQKRLGSLLAEFAGADDRGAKQEFGITLVLYPTQSEKKW